MKLSNGFDNAVRSIIVYGRDSSWLMSLNLAGNRIQVLSDKNILWHITRSTALSILKIKSKTIAYLCMKKLYGY